MGDLGVEIEENIQIYLNQIQEHLEQGIIPFWLQRGIDEKFGGYLTCFDEKGQRTEDTDKYIVTQTRMIWGFSHFYKHYPDKKELRKAAEQGVQFFIKHFWDQQHGGWNWRTKRDGTLVDAGKVTYGQSFAIYALAEYTLATNDPIGLEYAEKTFDLLQEYGTDTLRGGYFENLEPDWTLSDPGFHAGDRKSLDIHMHLLEAFTTLAECSKKEIHASRLEEVVGIILDKMIHKESGCGLNQFDLDFHPIPAINIRRTWNAERVTGEVIEAPTDTTSYGHNVELAWLLTKAGDLLGIGNEYNGVITKLVNHALKYGIDYENGGVYRDGPHEGEPLVYDKEWWQNCESLVGFLDAYERLGNLEYLYVFSNIWSFCYKYMINHELGEWRQLLNKNGEILVGDIGNPWKAIYHSGRAMMECKLRLERILLRESRNKG